MDLIKKLINKGVDLPLLECMNPYKDIWAIRYEIGKEDDCTLYAEAWTKGRPSIDEIRAYLYDASKAEEAEKVCKSFVWHSQRTGKDYPILLDEENQRNYTEQFRKLKEDGLPLSNFPFFFGLQSELPYTFESVEEMTQWHNACFVFVATIKAEYIAKRNSININDYNL